MGEAIEDVEKEIEFIDKIFIFETDKTWIAHEEILKRIENVILTENLEKTDKTIKRVCETLEKHKQIDNQTNKSKN